MKHVVIHPGSPQDDGVGWTIAGLVAGAIYLWLVLSFIATFWVWLVGAVGVGTAMVVYRHLTKLKRLGSHADKISASLERKRETYLRARDSIAALAGDDKTLAEDRLIKLRDESVTLCRQLEDVGKEITSIKHDIIRKLGTVPVDDLNAKLKPLTIIEHRIEHAVDWWNTLDPAGAPKTK